MPTLITWVPRWAVARTARPAYWATPVVPYIVDAEAGQSLRSLSWTGVWCSACFRHRSVYALFEDRDRCAGVYLSDSWSVANVTVAILFKVRPALRVTYFPVSWPSLYLGHLLKFKRCILKWSYSIINESIYLKDCNFIKSNLEKSFIWFLI
jgi:hypothetical protein